MYSFLNSSAISSRSKPPLLVFTELVIWWLLTRDRRALSTSKSAASYYFLSTCSASFSISTSLLTKAIIFAPYYPWLRWQSPLSTILSLSSPVTCLSRHPVAVGPISKAGLGNVLCDKVWYCRDSLSFMQSPSACCEKGSKAPFFLLLAAGFWVLLAMVARWLVASLESDFWRAKRAYAALAYYFIKVVLEEAPVFIIYPQNLINHLYYM